MAHTWTLPSTRRGLWDVTGSSRPFANRVVLLEEASGRAVKGLCLSGPLKAALLSRLPLFPLQEVEALQRP